MALLSVLKQQGTQWLRSAAGPRRGWASLPPLLIFTRMTTGPLPNRLRRALARLVAVALLGLPLVPAGRRGSLHFLPQSEPHPPPPPAPPPHQPPPPPPT